MTELKPCPFCGGEAHLRDWEDGEGFRYQVICQECEGSSDEYYADSGQTIHAEIDATDRWNTRPKEEQLQQALRDALVVLERIPQTDEIILHIEDALK